MTRKVGGDSSPLGWLFKALAGDPPAQLARPKKEKRLRLDRDSRRGMSGRQVLASYASRGPMTLEELLARLTPEQREAVLALSEARQGELLAVYEAMDRRLEAPAGHKAAILDKLARMTTSGRLVRDRHGGDGVLPVLAERLDMPLAGPMRSRMDGNLFLSHVIDIVAEPRPQLGTSAGRAAGARSGLVEAEREVGALANSLAIGWPADWARLATALAFAGHWQGVAAVAQIGGSPSDSLLRASLLAFAHALPADPRDPPEARAEAAAADALSLAQHDALARILDVDRGAEIEVEGRDPNWALEWLEAQILAGHPARVGLFLDGRALTVRLRQLGPHRIQLDSGNLPRATFLTALRRALVDGEFLAQVTLT